MICSDNGPEFHCGSAGPFKGLKSTLFEGGVRSPLIVWGPGFTHPEKPGSVNTKSVFSAIDLTPSLLNFAKVSVPEPVQFDGQPLLDTLLGKSVDSHKGALYFRRPPDRKSFRNLKNLPDLAIRYGKWKLLCDYGGGRPMLFDLEADPSEANNLANQHPEIVERLAKAIVQWNMGLPKDAGDPTYNGNKE